MSKRLAKCIKGTSATGALYYKRNSKAPCKGYREKNKKKTEEDEDQKSWQLLQNIGCSKKTAKTNFT